MKAKLIAQTGNSWKGFQLHASKAGVVLSNIRDGQTVEKNLIYWGDYYNLPCWSLQELAAAIAAGLLFTKTLKKWRV